MKRLHLIFILCLASAVACATQTEKFNNDTFYDFAEGDPHGVAITSDGFLKIGPTTSKWSALPVSVLWATLRGTNGDLFVAAGNEGQVFKIGANGKPAVFFKAAELQVQALAFDKTGNLYAASAPDGKIYKLDASGKSSVFFEPKEKYIWALQFDDDGNLFAATGDKGKLFKIASNGKGKVFYDSDETHLRTLLLDSKKRLWVGSDGSGLVYRFDKTGGTEGSPFVAYDSSHREIKALVAGAAGGIFVAAIGNGKSAPGSMPGALKAITAANSAVPTTPTPPPADAAKPAEETLSAPETPGAGEIIRIRPDGSIEKWWSGLEDVYALAEVESGHIWAGTGHKGKVIEFTAPRQFSILGQLEAETITALLPGDKGRWLAATSNGGAIWSLNTAPGRKGTFESVVLEAHASSQWGALDSRTIASQGKIEFQTRSGNTSKPDKVWSPWTTLDKQNRVTSPVAHFLQYKILLEAGASSAPAVDSVTLFYRASNQPPRLSRISVLQPNIDLVKAPKVELALPAITPNYSGARGGKSGSDATEEAYAAYARTPVIQQIRRLGWRAATWQANDANSDEIRFAVLSRSAGSEEWKILKADLANPFISWDAATWPDGDYYLKVVGTDRPSNAEDEALSDETTSDVFTVDNTAPTIKADPPAETVPKGFLGLTIADTTSIVDEAEYSLDGEDWRPLPPVSGIYDAKANTFRIPLDKLKPGDHHAVVRASDSSNNVATETIRFKK